MNCERDRSRNRRCDRKRMRTCGEPWTFEDTTTLVECYEMREILWNPISTDFKNRLLRTRALTEIANQLNRSKEEVLAKWNLLRNNFRNLYMKHLAGSSKPNWMFYDSLMFLVPVLLMSSTQQQSISESGENTQEAQHAIKREFYDTISVDSNSQYSDIHDGNASSVPSQEDNESSVGILKRRNTSKNGIPKFVDEFISQDNDNRQGQEVGTTSDDPLVKIPRLSVLNEHADHADDYFQTFGKYVASELRSLQSTENRNKLRRMIQKAIFEVGELDDAAAIN